MLSSHNTERVIDLGVECGRWLFPSVEEYESDETHAVTTRNRNETGFDQRIVNETTRTLNVTWLENENGTKPREPNLACRDH